MSTLGWRAIFLVNVPVAVVAVAIGTRALPESAARARRLDLLGVGLSIVALASIVFALIEGAAVGWTSPAVLTTAVVGLLAGFAFVRVKLGRREPLLDVTALARPRVVAGAAAILAIYIAFLGILFLLPQYLRYVHGSSTLVSGLILAPIGLGSPDLHATKCSHPGEARGAPDNRRRSRWAGGRRRAAAPAAPNTSVVVVMLSMALFGALTPLTIAPATAVIMDDLGEEEAGDGGAINQLARQVGGALGVAIIGSVFAGGVRQPGRRQPGGLLTGGAPARRRVNRTGPDGDPGRRSSGPRVPARADSPQLRRRRAGEFRRGGGVAASCRGRSDDPARGPGRERAPDHPVIWDDASA